MSVNPECNWTPEEYAALCAQAEDPTTPPEALLRIEEEIDSRQDTRYDLIDHLYSLLLCHPNAPRDLLMRNVYSAPESFIRNPALPLLCLEHPDLLDGCPHLLLMNLLTYPALPVVFIGLCRAHASAAVAEAAHAHIAVAGELDPAGSEWEQIAFERLSRIPVGNWEALWELIEHDRAPRELAERLGFAAVHEPEHPSIRRRREKAAADAFDRPPLDLSEPLGGWDTLLATARNRARRLVMDPRTPADILTHCLFDGTASVLAWHPNVTTELLDRIGEYVFTDNPRFPAPALAFTLLSHPDTSAELAQRIRQHIPPAGDIPTKVEPLYRRLLRWHPTLVDDPPVLPEPESLHLVIDQEALETVLYLSAQPGPLPKWPQDARMVEPSPRLRPWYIRLAWALNPALDEDRRKFLAEDAHRVVRAAARARLLFPHKTLLGIPGAKAKG
jgi:hypothetical protein